MFIDGFSFSDRLGSNSCFMPFFRQEKNLKFGNNDTWIFGTVFMDQYYMIFD